MASFFCCDCIIMAIFRTLCKWNNVIFVWLLSLSIIILSSIHIVTYISSTFFLLSVGVFCCMQVTQCVHPFSWWHVWVVSRFSVVSNGATNICLCFEHLFSFLLVKHLGQCCWWLCWGLCPLTIPFLSFERWVWKSLDVTVDVSFLQTTLSRYN